MFSIDDKPYVIAEIGSNHNGKVENAIKLIDMAYLAGADAVKLQKRYNRILFTNEMYNRPYDGYGPTYGEHREKLDFNYKQFTKLMNYADGKGITLFATPFDEPSVDFLEALGVRQYKVASASVTNHLLLEKIIKTGKPTIMSVGGQSAYDIVKANELFPYEYPLTILHCVAAYPCPPEMMNLQRIPVLKELTEREIGLSDHHDGISLGAAAYALGARVFEKHITLDHNAKGTDHRFSLEYYGLQQYIKYLNQAKAAFALHKQPMESEIAPIRKMSQSLYWSMNLREGAVIAPGNIVAKSPGHPDGIHPTRLNIEKFLDRTLAHDVKIDDLVSWDNI